MDLSGIFGTLGGVLSGKVPLSVNVNGTSISLASLIPKALFGGIKIADIKALPGADAFTAEFDLLDKLYGGGVGLSDLIADVPAVMKDFNKVGGAGPVAAGAGVTSALASPTPSSSTPAITSFTPGVIKVEGARDANNPEVARSEPYDVDTHIALDLQLAEPLPWPGRVPSTIDCLFDGAPSDGLAFSAGSVDADGYKARVNVVGLPDDKPHTGTVVWHLNGKTSSLSFRLLKGGGIVGIYQAGFYRADSKQPRGWTYYNGRNKQLAKPGDPPFGGGPEQNALADKWIQEFHPADGGLLKSPFNSYDGKAF